jgi:hypothetical protein
MWIVFLIGAVALGTLLFSLIWLAVETFNGSVTWQSGPTYPYYKKAGNESVRHTRNPEDCNS